MHIRRCLSKTSSTEKAIKFDIAGEKDNVAIVKIDSASTLNAMGNHIWEELLHMMFKLEKDMNIGAIVFSGCGKTFCVGSDINEMNKENYQILKLKESNYEKFGKCSKPTIAAVNGYALGGGCEIAMMCDIIFASQSATFSLPEILLGTIPGGGGSQRLPRSVGKSKAMELCLVGDHITSEEAFQYGLISNVYPDESLMSAAIRTAEKIAGHSRFATHICKDAVNASFEMTLADGIRYEKILSRTAIATLEQRKNINAFFEKRTVDEVD